MCPPRATLEYESRSRESWGGGGGSRRGSAITSLMGFFLRKLIGTLLTPSIILAVAVAVGTLFQFSERRRRQGRRILVAGVLGLLTVSLGIPFDAIGRWLEGLHPAIMVPEEARELAGVRWIVVLGGGLRSGERLPLSSRPNDASIFRVVESWSGGRILSTEPRAGQPTNREFRASRRRRIPLASRMGESNRERSTGGPQPDAQWVKGPP